MIYHIAQVNVARLRAPLDSEELADFVASLAPVNASADGASGFVWRLQAEDGNSTSIRAFEWDLAESAGVIVNMSVWETIEQLSAWVHGSMHRSVLLQRGKWFERVAEATTALWWIRACESCENWVQRSRPSRFVILLHRRTDLNLRRGWMLAVSSILRRGHT